MGISKLNGRDRLTVFFDQAVVPIQVNIYQTYNPGAITSVELLPTDGANTVIIPNSANPGTTCPGVFSLGINMADLPLINAVRINLDQTITGSWNENNAVEVVGRVTEAATGAAPTAVLNDSERITEQNLIGTTWEFGRSNGTVIAARLTLQANGVIGGYSHRNESSWGVDAEGIVTFYTSGGTPSTRFTTVTEVNGLLAAARTFPPRYKRRRHPRSAPDSILISQRSSAEADSFCLREVIFADVCRVDEQHGCTV